MIKNYLLAVMLSCAVTASFGQKNFVVGKVGLSVGLAAPTVDGVIDAAYLLSNSGQMGVLENCIDNSTLLCNAPGATGCNKTTKWSAVYDDNSLYIVADVTDENPNSGDAIELFFAMDNNKLSNCPGQYPAAYNEVTFQIVSKSPNAPVFGVTATNVQAAGSVVKKFIKLTPKGYIMEFELSWFEMDYLSNGAEPTLGRKIGFDISNNQGASTRTAQSMWNQSGGNRNWTDPSGFGTITLGDPLAVNSLTSLVNNVTISPNPATNEAKLMIDAKQQDEVSIAVLNTLSQKVYSSTQVIALGNNNHTIPTADLANGIYTVVISKGNLNTTKKLVINK